MKPRTYDLFGEIPVTVPEIEAWLRAVPRIEPGTTRAAYYVTAWNVPAKIRAAKQAGTFEELTRRADHSPFWWTRLRWTHLA